MGFIDKLQDIDRRWVYLLTWIFAVPNMATNRAVMIGAALGAIALAVRTLMGIERGYLRGGGD